MRTAKLWLEWTGAQADLNLLVVHIHIVDLNMSWFKHGSDISQKNISNVMETHLMN